MPNRKNMLKQNMNKCLVGLCLMLSVFYQVKPQSSYFMRHYSTKDYGSNPIIWSFVQDARGLLFAANANGVLIFDGASWQTIPTPTPARSLFITPSNQILVGCKSDFGTLEYAKNGQYYYKSWRSFLNKQDQLLLKDVEKIYQTAEANVYISDNVIFRATTSGGIQNFKKFVLEDRVLGSGIVQNKIWVNINGKGIHTVENDLKPLPAGQLFKDKEIAGITKNSKEQYFVATYEGDIYLYNGNFLRIATQADAYLKSNKIYDIAAVGEHLAVATMKGGTVYLTTSGQTLAFFNKENGIPDNDMYAVYGDKENNLWLAHGKGVTKIAVQLPVNIYGAAQGLQGRIADVLRFQNTIYVATSQGAFIQKGNTFQLIPNTATECWHLKSLNNRVLLANNQGVWDITNGNAKPVISNEYAVHISESNDPNTAYALTIPGLYKLSFKNGQWTNEKKFNEVNMELNSLEVDEQGKLWAGTAIQGVFQFEISNAAKIFRYDTSAGLPEGNISVFKYQKKIYFKSNKGIYSFNNGRFTLEPNLNQIIKNYPFDIHQDQIWLKTEQGYFAVQNNQLDSTGYHNLLRQQPQKGFADEQFVLLGIGENLIVVQRLNIPQKPFQVFIRSLTLGRDSLYFGGNYITPEGAYQSNQTPNFQPSVIYSLNHLTFHLGTNSFLNEAANQYSYLLEGSDNPQWSEWTTNPIIEFNGISEGNYTLKVKAKNAIGQTSEITTFTFKVTPPWYRSIWTILLGVIILAFMVYAIIRYNSKRLEAENRRLDAIVKERTAQVEKQKQEIEKAYVELKNTQDQLVQSEKMAFLGQLVAGIAHEINTPIGAVNASATNISKILPNTMSQLPNALKKLNDNELHTFQQITEQILNFEGNLTSREERQYKKDISQKLEEMGVDTSIATELVKVGLIQGIENYASILKRPDGIEIIQAAANLGKIKKNVDTIETAVAKTQKIVFALKSYSYRTPDEKAVPINLVENMQTILTIYANQLKYGVEVTTHFEDNLPEIMGWPDELSQVWTNIIHNALQAMDNKGTLTIDILKQTNSILVKITDSGPGIPKEIQDKIFNPFFTTKKQGEGSGLGLDICKKIVEKHKGKIGFDTEPGRTTFIIELPIS